MQQQQNYRHSVDSGDYFLIEMMTNHPSPFNNRQCQEGEGWEMVELSKVESERKRGKAWEAAETVETLARWMVGTSRPSSLTHTSHGWPGKSCNCATLTFHNDVLLSKNLSAWFDSIKCVLHEFRT